MHHKFDNEIRDFLINAGADLVGFASLVELPSDTHDSMPNGVSFAMAIKPQIVEEIFRGPTKNYEREYNHLNSKLDKIAASAVDFINSKGYKAKTTSATQHELDSGLLETPLPHKTVATLSGLGWIGKCALLVTREFGSAVRLNSVLTDAPITPGTPEKRSRCGNCEWCIEKCPTDAILGEEWIAGRPREEFFDAFACCEKARDLCRIRKIEATICGACISACPWTQKYVNKALYS